MSERRVSREFTLDELHELVQGLGEDHWLAEELTALFEAYPWSHRDRLAAMVYQVTAQSPTEQTAESWARVCRRFKHSAKKCYDEVDRMVEDGEVELLD